MIGRLGRSLHIHLLLASQRLEEGKLRGSTHTCLTGWASRRSRPASLAACSVCRTPTICRASPARRSSNATPTNRFGSTPPTCRVSTSAPADVPDRADVAAGRPGAEAVHRDAGRQGCRAGRTDRERHRRGRCGNFVGAHQDHFARRRGGQAARARASRSRSVAAPLEASPAVNVLLPNPRWSDPANRNGRLWLPIGVVDRPYDQRRDSW